MKFRQIEGKPIEQALIRRDDGDPLADPIRVRAGGDTLPSYPDEDTPGLLEYWHILRRHTGAILALAIAGLIVAVAITLPQTPIYRVRTSIELQGFNENFLNMKSMDPTSALPDYSPEGYIRTQMKILQSDTLMRRVISKLTADPSAPAPVAPAGTRESLRSRLHLSPTKVLSRNEALAGIASSLQVNSADNTHIVEIFCDSPYPQLAADFANTLVKEYIEHNLESRWKTTQYTGDWLRTQLQDLRAKLERSETELQTYAAGAGLQITQEKTSVAEEKLRQLQEEMLRAQAERVTRQSKYEAALSKPVESLGEVLDDPMLREQQVRLMDLNRQYAELSSTMQPTHYKVERIQAQIAEVRQSLEGRRDAVIKRIRNDFESASRREKLLGEDYTQQNNIVTEQAQRRIRYDILKREVDTNRQLYEALLQRVKEAGISAAMRASNISVVDQAFPATAPYKPRLVRNAAMGIMAGLMFGVAFAFIRERADRTLQSPGDVAQYLNLLEHGVIPSGQIESTGRRLGWIPGVSNGSGGDRQELVTWQRRHSLMTESFRSAVASILFLWRKNNKEPLVIAFTSASPSEGKTLVTANMGPAMAETQRRVLLIDADLRKPRIHTVLMMDNPSGLSDLLQQPEPLTEREVLDAIRPTQVKGLDVLTSGPGSADLTNLLYSSRVGELFAIVRRNYDVVLVDTPPMMPMPDARILARYATGVMLVVRAGSTTRDTAMVAKQRFDDDGIPVIGAILNDWKASSRSGYGYKAYYKSYSRYHTDGNGNGNGSHGNGSNGNGNGNRARKEVGLGLRES